MTATKRKPAKKKRSKAPAKPTKSKAKPTKARPQQDSGDDGYFELSIEWDGGHRDEFDDFD